MSEIAHIATPRHQLADDWAEQLDEHLYWMSRNRRESFPIVCLERALEALTPLDLALAVDGDYMLEEALREYRDIHGEDE